MKGNFNKYFFVCEGVSEIKGNFRFFEQLSFFYS